MNIVNALKSNADESLMVADYLFKEDISPLWVIVSSYYSMYYIANAVLRDNGFEVGEEISHKVTNEALIVLVRSKLKKVILEEFEEAQNETLELTDDRVDDIIELFELEKNKRSHSQYRMQYDVRVTRSKTSLDRAKQFNFELEKLLDVKD